MKKIKTRTPLRENLVFSLCSKIGTTILAAVMIVGLVFGMTGFANSSFNVKGSDNSQADYVQDEIIVKFKGDTEPFRVIKVPKGKVIENVKAYHQRPEVEYAEPNYFVFALDNGTTADTNDTYIWNQWALNNEGQTIYKSDGEGGYTKLIGEGTSGADTDWDKAWDGFSAFSFTDTVVAIIDSGIDETHPDLKNRLWINGDEVPDNGLDDDSNGFIDDTWGWDFVESDNAPHDIYGHGTHVSGIAAAETNNSLGIAGTAFSNNIKIMPVRVLNDDGFGYTSDVALGIRYAADNGAKVINLSLGRRRDTNTLRNAVNYAWDKGVVLAAAAGNDGGGGKYYPASYPNVISVAATDYNDNTASFSNFNSEIDVSAPGVNVFSTFPTYEFTIGTKYSRSQNYDVGSGTSMSVPHVVGLAGLLFAQDPNRTKNDVRNIIEATTDDLGSEGWDRHFGWGRVNVYNALSDTVNVSPIVNVVSPVDGDTFGSGDTIFFEGTASDTEDGDLTANLIWTSSLDGQIGTGGSFSIILSDGNHIIIASVSDSGGKTGSASVGITVGTPPPTATTVSVSSITYTTEGGKNQDKHLLISVALIDDLEQVVADASVSIDLFRDESFIGTGTGTTGIDGTVTFALRNAPSGCYETTVTNVTAEELIWDGIPPENIFCK